MSLHIFTHKSYVVRLNRTYKRRACSVKSEGFTNSLSITKLRWAVCVTH